MKQTEVIIECPKGSSYKYDYKPKTKVFKLSKILPAGMTFPFDFGFIPDTRGEDGDPLDIIVISEVCSFTGCAMDCRIIGAITAEQTERDGRTVRNDRFLGIPLASQMFGPITDISQLPHSILDQLEAFFKNYNEQAGKQFKVLERLDAGKAGRLIKNG